MRGLHEFTTELLTHRGALLEHNDNGLEVLLPPDVATDLEIPEHTGLLFSRDQDGKNGRLVTYDTDLFKNMARLLTNRGQFSITRIPPPSVRIDKLEQRLKERVILNNAVFHIEKREEQPLSYLLAYFKYTALSDERQEGIIALMINPLNLSVRKLPSWPWDFLTSSEEEPPGSCEAPFSEKVLRALYKAQTAMVKEDLQDFIRSLERRLNRDIQRVDDYYFTLAQEAQKVIEKKGDSREDTIRTSSKIEAIEGERRWKIQDLIAKYRITIQIEPISFIRVDTVTAVLWLLIKRRKGSRLFPLTYNPIIKALDILPCEECFHPKKSYLVCDDNLHIVCNRCFMACSRCSREYCRACYPIRCPRCEPPGARSQSPSH